MAQSTITSMNTAEMEMHPDRRHIVRINQLTMRTLSMKTSLEDNLSRCHQQDQSPLYNKFPKEMSDLIFAFATSQNEDKSRAYKNTAFHYRPGHTAPHKTDTNLLLTCRRIWLESNALPVKQAVFTSWLRSERGPPPPRERRDPNPQHPVALNQSLTKLNKQNVTSIHFFLQMCIAESMFQPRSFRDRKVFGDLNIFGDLRPKFVRITIRHTDWWWWERDEALRLEDEWVQQALDCIVASSVEEFVLELETLERNKDQLQTIVNRLLRLKSKDVPVEATPENSDQKTRFEITDEPAIWHWTGPTNINDEEYEPYEGLNKLDYHVVELTWKRVKIHSTDEDTPETPDIEANTPILGPRRRQFRGPIRLHRGGWDRNSYHFVEYLVRKESVERANDTERGREQRFRKMFADIEARKFEERWEAEKSLLKFED